MDLTVERVSHRLREPVRTAWGAIERRDLVRVEVREGGHAGLGEAAPLPGYDAAPGALDGTVAVLEGVAGEETLESALDRLAGEGALGRAGTIAPARDAAPAGTAAAALDAAPARHAHAALEMAAWDLRGRREGRPVAALLAADPLAAVPVNALIAADDRAGASAQALSAVRAGFRCVKVKVATGDDAGRLAAVRAAAGPGAAIRIDANRGWSLQQARATLEALAPVGIELCEEPTASPEDLAELRAVGVPLALDESATVPGALRHADAVCLRLGRHGGIGPLMQAARAARAAGVDVYLSSTFDGPAGIAAALHAAAALRVTRPCGLATLALLDDVDDPFPPRDGAIGVPDRPGLGIRW